MKLKLLSKEGLAEIRKRADKASPGPWKKETDTFGDDTSAYKRCYWLTGPQFIEVDGSYFHNRDDALFIAHAREDIPRLVDQVERLRMELELLRRIALMGVPYQYDSGGAAVCGYCGCAQLYAVDKKRGDHRADCVWLRWRQEFGDKNSND